jgi:anti-sigma B factor antagonist
MQIQKGISGAVTVISLVGEVNSRTANRIEEEILPLVVPGCKLLLDMRDVEYMSSAGLRMLLLLHREVENQAGRVILVGLQEMIRDTMAITGFLDFFEDYEGMANGLEALGDHEAN